MAWLPAEPLANSGLRLYGLTDARFLHEEVGVKDKFTVAGAIAFRTPRPAASRPPVLGLRFHCSRNSIAFCRPMLAAFLDHVVLRI
jgi:Tfp pilus assembly protein PilZ